MKKRKKITLVALFTLYYLFIPFLVISFFPHKPLQIPNRIFVAQNTSIR